MSVLRTIKRTGDDLPETSAFRFTSPCFRLARNTSASSSKRTHPHFCARVKYSSRRLATDSGIVPRSPQVTGKRGRRSERATHSAVLVFPTPIKFRSVNAFDQDELRRTWNAVQQDDQTSAFSFNDIHGNGSMEGLLCFLGAVGRSVELPDLVLHQRLN
jgi:hypothetical protein